MKIFVLAEPGEETESLRSALRDLDVELLQEFPTLDFLLDVCSTDPPHVVVISYAAGLAEGMDAIFSADERLRQLGAPAVILLAERFAQDEEQLRAMTGFRHFLVAPFDAQSAGMAILSATSIQSEEATPAPSSPGAEEGEGEEWSWQPTPKPGDAATSGAANTHAESGAAGDGTAADVTSESEAPGDGAAGAEEAGTGERVVTVELPQIACGELAQVRFPRVLHAVGVLGVVGRLRLTHNKIERKVICNGGAIGLEGAPSKVEEQKFYDVFGWTDGTWTFQDVPARELVMSPLGTPIGVLAHGISRHLTTNDFAQAIGPFLKKYPVVTDQAVRYGKSLRDLSGMGEFLDSVSGEASLERLMAAAGANIEGFLRNGYIAWLVSAVAFFDAPCADPVRVEFHEATGSHAPGAEPRSRQRAHSGPAPVVVTEADRAKLQEMREQYELFSRLSPHEIFRLSRGCGRRAVGDRFYDLVREHHPDVYGSYGDPAIKVQAEKTFLLIRTAYDKLLKLETVTMQTPAVAGAGSSRAGGTPAPSGPQGADTGPQRQPAPDPSRARNVDDLAEKLRRAPLSRAPAGPAAAGAAGPSPASSGPRPGMATAAPRSVQSQSAEQIFAGCRRAVEAGSFPKAQELLQSARQKGMTGGEIDAYEVYVRVQLGELPAPDGRAQLDKLVSDAMSPRYESVAHNFLGHLARADGEDAKALSCYVKAVSKDPDNQDAVRWARHLKMKQEKAKPEGFFSKLFQKGKK